MIIQSTPPLFIPSTFYAKGVDFSHRNAGVGANKTALRNSLIK
jgi:hypothetical protein